MAKLFTKADLDKLAKAGPEGRTAIMKIFNPYGPGTWIITGQDAHDPDILYCVADLDQGCREFGPVRRSELEGVRIGRFGWKLERDRFFAHEGKPVEFFTEAETLVGI